MCDNRFYICKHCGNLVGMIQTAVAPIMCCSQKMALLEHRTAEASMGKHIPVITVEDNTVKVEVVSVQHPMAEEHIIQ